MRQTRARQYVGVNMRIRYWLTLANTFSALTSCLTTKNATMHISVSWTRLNK
jgi:hypothetical protein